MEVIFKPINSEVDEMDEADREMEIIALLSNPEESYSYINTDKEVIEHTCESTGEARQIKLVEVEYFMESGVREDRANFCEHCKQVFVYKSEG